MSVENAFPVCGRRTPWVCLLAFLLLAPRLALRAQQPSAPASGAQTSGEKPEQHADQNQEQNPVQGGPAGDNGVIVTPKKQQPAASAAPPAPAEPVIKTPPALQNYSLHINVPIVSVNVGVLLEKTHAFVPNLKPANFVVYEDGKPQKVTHFSQTQAPITAVLLLEFAATNYNFIYDMRTAAYAFSQQLRPDDYIAVMTYDLRTQILTDFTQDKRVVDEALSSLTLPTWRETNLFDALYQTLDRLTRINGRKYVVLISSGRDTFSKVTLDKVLDKIKATPNVTIFTVGTGQFARIMAEGRGMSGSQEIGFAQADNQLATFAHMTGGGAFFPRFEGEMPDIFHQIDDSIRNQYVLTYSPTNVREDGTYRHIEVDLVDDEGKPLRIQDEKGRPLRYEVVYRDGYRAKLPVQ